MPDVSIATLLAAVKAVFEADKKLREKTKGFDPFKKATNKYLEGVLATCDRMKIFGMTEPVSLQGIYVRVNILEKLTRLARLTPEEIEKAFKLKATPVVDGMTQSLDEAKARHLERQGARRGFFSRRGVTAGRYPSQSVNEISV